MVRLSAAFGSVKPRGIDMNFSDEIFVDNHIPDFSVKGWFLFKFLYKVYSSSVFCTAKYRGGVPKDGGVEKTQQGERIGLQSPPPAVPRSIIPGCGGSHIREVERSDGGVENNITSGCLY